MAAPVAFLCGLAALAVHTILHPPEGTSNEEICITGFNYTFVTWHGLALVLALSLLGLVVGWRAGREAVRRMSLLGLWCLFAALGTASVLVGLTFTATTFGHYVFRYGPWDFLRFVGHNAAWSLGVTAFILTWTRPWRFVPAAGLLRTLALAMTLLLLNYLLASLVCMIRGPFWIE